jgi:outer membrane lipase/esterase
MFRLLYGAMIATTLVSSPALAQSATNHGRLFNSVTVFGDSITDSGNIPALSGNFDETPSPPYFNGRFSNGPVFVELFPDFVGVGPDHVRNFAIGGATFGDITISAILGDNPAIAQQGVASQVRAFVASGERLGRLDLVQLNGGNNDFGAVLLTSAPESFEADLIAAADKAGADFGQSVRALQGIGASQFLVQTTLSVQGIPNFNDPAILAADALYVPRLNANLVAEMNRAARKGDIFYVLDTRTIVLDALANPAKYGYADVTTPCLDFEAGTVCTDDATRLWWDGQHPTRRGHEMLAAAATDTLVAPRTLSAQAESVSASTLAALRRTGGPASGWRFADGSALTVAIARDAKARSKEPFAIGYDQGSTAFGVGYRWQIGEDWRLGVGTEISTGRVTLAGRVDGQGLGGFSSNGGRVTVSAQGRVGPVLIEAATVAGGDRLSDIRRRTGVAGQVARGETRATSQGSSLYLSYPLAMDALVEVSPFAGVQSLSTRVESYRETGAVGLDQAVRPASRDVTRWEIGLAASARLQHVRLDGSLAWNGSASGPDSLARSSLATVPEIVRALPVGQERGGYGQLSLAASFPVSERVSLSLGGSAELGGDQDNWGALVSLTYRP